MPDNLAVVIQVALVGGILYLLFRGGGCCGVPARRAPDRSKDQTPSSQSNGAHQPPDPMQVLKVRLATGEINVDEYERLRKQLR